MPAPQVGWNVWKTDDPAMYRALRATLREDHPAHAAIAGRRCTSTRESASRCAIALSDGVQPRRRARPARSQAAAKRPLTEECLREQLGRLGDTPFELRRPRRPARPATDGARSACSTTCAGALVRAIWRRSAATSPAYRNPAASALGAAPRIQPVANRTATPQLVASSCRTLDQVRAALDAAIATLDRLRLRGRPPVPRRGAARARPGRPDRARDAADPSSPARRASSGTSSARARRRSWSATSAAPRVLPQGGARPAADRRLLPERRQRADGRPAHARRACARLVPSYDLNWEQLAALVRAVDPGRFEVVIHQHMPMFHMEHCVFAAFLSDRQGLPRLRPAVRPPRPRRSRTGRAGTPAEGRRRLPQHRLQRRPAERLAVRPPDARSGDSLVPGGIAQRDPRGGPPARSRDTRNLLDGKEIGENLWRELRASNVMGVTRGPLGRDE